MFKNLTQLAKVMAFPILLSGCVSSTSYAKFEPMLDESAMDLTADPCVDFKQYACGKWEERTVLPGDKSRWIRSFSSIDKENLEVNKQLLEDFAAGKNLNMTKNAKKLGDFYGACLNTKKIALYTDIFLNKEFARIDSVSKDPSALAQLVGQMQNEGVDVFASFGSEQDLNDSSQMIGRLDQGGMGLPSKDYYVDAAKAPIREKYVEHISKMLELSGFSQESAQISAKEVLKFETALAQKALLPVEQRDPKATYHIQTTQQLQKLSPNFNWDVFFTTLETPQFVKLNVAIPTFVSNLNTLIASMPLEQLKTYLKWHLVSAFSADLGGEYAQQHFEFFDRTLKGQKEPTARWEYCLNQTDGSLADALGEAFVAKTFGPESKAKTLEILNAVQSAFESNLNNLEWMDEATRQYAEQKLNAFDKKIGYPNTWRDLTSLNVDSEHMDNVLAASHYAKQWNINKIGQPVDRTEWGMTPPTVNAYYNPSNNEIVFPAGILQSPFFQLKAPVAANYGAFGVVIGHEMTHGFDDQGSQYDLSGNLRNWWTPGTDRIFNQKAQCLVDQYSQYTVADGVHINGKLTLGENIADLGGMKMSLTALESSFSNSMTEEEKIAERKKFFVAFGQIWCAKVSPEYEKLAAATDPHSPPKYRINGVVTNTPEFAKAFQCTTGKPLAPAKRCSIW